MEFFLDNEFYIRTTFCLHELKRTVDAKVFLLDGPKSLQEEAIYFYNMACYETQLGNITEAKRYLSLSFKMRKQLKAEALEDPVLEPIWSVFDDKP